MAIVNGSSFIWKGSVFGVGAGRTLDWIRAFQWCLDTWDEYKTNVQKTLCVGVCVSWFQSQTLTWLGEINCSGTQCKMSSFLPKIAFQEPSPYLAQLSAKVCTFPILHQSCLGLSSQKQKAEVQHIGWRLPWNCPAQSKPLVPSALSRLLICTTLYQVTTGSCSHPAFAALLTHFTPHYPLYITKASQTLETDCTLPTPAWYHLTTARDLTYSGTMFNLSSSHLLWTFTPFLEVIEF